MIEKNFKTSKTALRDALWYLVSSSRSVPNNKNRRFLPLFTKGLPFIVGWVLLLIRTNEEDVIVDE